MAIVISSAPAVEPVAWDPEIKAQLRLYTDEERQLVEGFHLPAARLHLEQTILRRALITQTVQLTLDEWPEGNTIWLPRPPLQSVTSIVYTDDDGDSSTFSSSSYIVDTAGTPGRIVLKRNYSWPGVTLQAANGIVITYVAGYGDTAADVPANIKQGLLLLLGDFYENRENSLIMQGATFIDLPFTIQALLRSDRVLDERVSV